MKLMSGLLAVLVVVLLGALIWAAQPAASDSAIYRFQAQAKGNACSRCHPSGPVLTLQVAPAAGGKAIEVVVANNGPKGSPYNPPQFVLDLVNDLKPGDLLDLKTAVGAGHINQVAKIERYKTRPGEDEPGVFVFEKLTGGPDHPVVTLSKYRISQTLPLMLNKGANDKIDPEQQKVAEALKTGESVEVEVGTLGGQPVIKSLVPYVAPQRGTFVKMTEAVVGEAKLPAIEVTPEKAANSVALVISGTANAAGKIVPNPELLKLAKTLKPGQAILFKTTKDDRATWLRQVRLIPADGPADKADSHPATPAK